MTTVTTNLADFGDRELHEAITILETMIENGLPDDFETDEVQFMFNADSGMVFLTNADAQVSILNGDTLESYYVTPSGIEGIFEDIAEEYIHMDEEDQEFLDSIANGRPIKK